MPRYEFLHSHNLTTNSKPHEWFEAFLPSQLIGQLTTFTNLKAILSNAGKGCEIYPDFNLFSPNELRKHIGVYFVQGLAPSPNINMKFKGQRENDINGNDLIHRCLGPNATRCHKDFR